MKGNNLWVWRENKISLPTTMADGKPWPKISIVTPSFNQGKYIEETIRSVVMQGYPNLEYIVIDGGSTDNTIDIIHKYSSNIAYWVSEKDRGQTHAINKGFERATGDILAYLNSDDVYMPYTFSTIAELLTRWEHVKWITGIRSHLNETGTISTAKGAPRVFNRYLYSKGFNLSGFLGFNQQVSTFWRRELTQSLKLSEHLNCCMDLDVWLQLSSTYELVSAQTILGLMRVHAEQKSKTICSDLSEIENNYRKYALFSRSKRKLLYNLMMTPGIRALLRKSWCDGKGPIINWNPIVRDWQLVTKAAF